MHEEQCTNRCNPIPNCCNHPAGNNAANAFQSQGEHGGQESRLRRAQAADRTGATRAQARGVTRRTGSVTRRLDIRPPTFHCLPAALSYQVLSANAVEDPAFVAGGVVEQFQLTTHTERNG
jgi:hypothetical protein